MTLQPYERYRRGDFISTWGSTIVAERIFDRLPQSNEYFKPTIRRNKLHEPTTLIVDKQLSGTTIVATIRYGRVAGGVPVDLRRLARAFAKLGAVNGHVPTIFDFKWKPGAGDNDKIPRRDRPGDERYGR